MHCPASFWVENFELKEHPWHELFKVHSFREKDKQQQQISTLKNAAFIGEKNSASFLCDKHFEKNPKALLHRLNWERAEKTPYEISCLEKANEVASWGHKAAFEAFCQGKSELETHHAFLSAVSCSDDELPYHSIIAFDEKCSILHYP